MVFTEVAEQAERRKCVQLYTIVTISKHTRALKGIKLSQLCAFSEFVFIFLILCFV